MNNETLFYIMSIEKNIPQIVALRSCVEKKFGKPLNVHSDFLNLVADIENTLREHISESTLERVWGYSTRGYNTVSLRTLNVLTTYATGNDWKSFCNSLNAKEECESDIFSSNAIYTDELAVGDRLRIAWMPNRVCIIRYEGDNRFIAEECENSKMQPGDTFRCAAIYLGHELCVHDFRQRGNIDGVGSNYVIGKRNGLTFLKKL